MSSISPPSPHRHGGLPYPSEIMSRFGKSPDLQIRQQDPFNGGPPPGQLRRSFVTPSDLFFVRNHGNVPAVDAATYRLQVSGAVRQPLSLSLAELGEYPRHEIAATLQCAGNRRSEFAAVRPIPHELPWGDEAVSNAIWAGVRLSDVLRAAEPGPGARHAVFSGLDETERHGERCLFGGSVPFDKAMQPEVLLATEMNGEPLPPVHGSPLRVVVPGWIGARSVKWLGRIHLQETPSDNYFQAVAYRLFPAAVGPENVVWEEGTMLGEQCVNAFVTAPRAGEVLRAGDVRCEGIALAGGGRSIERVELSTDGGKSWIQTDLGHDQRTWSWRFWETTLPVTAGDYEIVVRAWDSASQTQPASVDQVWNFKGYMNNAWARVSFVVLSD